MGEIKNALYAAGAEAKYDEKVKRLLGNKTILAHILVRTVDEFQGMEPEEVEPFIEGEPLISVVAVEPGLTNMADRKSVGGGKSAHDGKPADSRSSGQRITGMNTESTEIGEGLVRFDIIFYVRMPSAGGGTDGVSQMIVNLEAQKDVPSGYCLMNRAVYYVCRMVSSQKERDFVGMNYDDIKRVFSIWIYLGMKENVLNHVHLAEDSLLGGYHPEAGLDLLNIVLIGLAEECPKKDRKGYELHRLLNTMLSVELPAAQKVKIMETEYHIKIDDRMREDVSEMCNLGQGVFEAGEACGEARGIALGEARGVAKSEERIILSMRKKGYPLEQIAAIMEKTVEEVKAVIEKKEKKTLV